MGMKEDLERQYAVSRANHWLALSLGENDNAAFCQERMDHYEDAYTMMSFGDIDANATARTKEISQELKEGR